jgi:molybdopterin-containing oxidoreductase family membrane subunit
MIGGGFFTWELWIVAHLFIGVSVGAFLLSVLPYVFGVKLYEPLGKLMLLTALVAVLPVFVLLAWDSSSTKIWVVWRYGVYMLVLLGQLCFIMRERTDGKDRQIVRMLGIIGAVVALSLRTGPGTVPGLFPMTFLVSTLLSGGALVVCLASVFIRESGELNKTVEGLAKLVGALLGFQLLALMAEVFVALESGIPSQVATVRVILVGHSAWTFWAFQIFVGAIVPLLLLFWRPRITLKSSGIACFFIIVGVFAFLLNRVASPTTW